MPRKERGRLDDFSSAGVAPAATATTVASAATAATAGPAAPVSPNALSPAVAAASLVQAPASIDHPSQVIITTPFPPPPQHCTAGNIII